MRYNRRSGIKCRRVFECGASKILRIKITFDQTGGNTFDGHHLELSGRRAQSVAGDLVSQNVNSVRIATEGDGKSQPIASNDTDADRAQKPPGGSGHLGKRKARLMNHDADPTILILLSCGIRVVMLNNTTRVSENTTII
jgi:hypothetical protein